MRYRGTKIELKKKYVKKNFEWVTSSFLDSLTTPCAIFCHFFRESPLGTSPLPIILSEALLEWPRRQTISSNMKEFIKEKYESI